MVDWVLNHAAELLSWAGLVLVLLFWLAVARLPEIYAYYLNWRRRALLRRIRANTCRACGYDLRENTHRCPECGAFIESSPERVDALIKLTGGAPGPTDEAAFVIDDTTETASAQGSAAPGEATGTTPSTGSPPSPG